MSDNHSPALNLYLPKNSTNHTTNNHRSGATEETRGNHTGNGGDRERMEVETHDEQEASTAIKMDEENEDGNPNDTPTIINPDPETQTIVDDEEEDVKQSFVNYLASPIIFIKVGVPPHETLLTGHLALLLRSPWFRDACASYSGLTPLQDRVVHLPGEDLDAVGAFLEFLYTGEYSPRLVPSINQPTEQVLENSAPGDLDKDGEQLLKHAKVYTLAEKLGLPSLKTLAHSKIHRINSSARGELRYARFVYENTTNTDKTIRLPIASFWAHRSHVLRHQAADEFKDMILTFPQFAYDVLSLVLDQKEKAKERDRERSEHHHPQRKETADRDAAGDDDDGPVGMTPSGKGPGGRSVRKRPRVSGA